MSARRTARGVAEQWSKGKDGPLCSNPNGAPQGVMGYWPTMFAGWENFYLMIGSSAAALIGLMFVVVTLTAGRGRAEVERGKHLYTSPIVWHLSAILVLSGAAMAPMMTARLFALTSAGLALLGFVIGMRNAILIPRLFGNLDEPGFDMFWYGIAPAIAYAGLAVGAAGVFLGRPWGSTVVATDLMALLLVSIHAEWDLVTYLAPLSSGEDRKH